VETAKTEAEEKAKTDAEEKAKEEAEEKAKKAKKEANDVTENLNVVYEPGSLAAHIHQNHRDMGPQKFDEVVLEWYVAALSQSQPNFKRSDLYIAMMRDVYRQVNPEKVGNVPRMIDGFGLKKPGAEEQVWAATMTKLYEKYGLSSVSERAAVFERYQLAGQPELKESCIAKLSAEPTKEQQEEREEQPTTKGRTMTFTMSVDSGAGAPALVLALVPALVPALVRRRRIILQPI
jgi:hypothetical protein